MAPKVFAVSSFESIMSTATMVAAPAMRAPWMTEMPTPPQPNTTTEEPGVTLAVLMAAPTPVMTAQPTREATSKGMSSSILIAPCQGMIVSRAHVPAPAMPNTPTSPRWNFCCTAHSNCNITHRWGDLWSTHIEHFPQGGDQATITWSPSTRLSTPAPTAVMTPAPSWPSTTGAGCGSEPVMAWRSEWQTPVASIWIFTWPGPGSATVRSSTISRVSSPVLCSSAPRIGGSFFGVVVGLVPVALRTVVERVLL